MTYKTHLSTGLLFSATFFFLILKINLTGLATISLIAATIIGSSAPDLDTPSGGLWRKIPAGGLLSRIIHPIFIGGHRHLSHSLLGLSIFTGLFYLLINKFSYLAFIHSTFYILIAFLLGYISHLIADMFTEMGIPLLFPWGYHLGIPPAPFEEVRIKTGKWFENLIVYPIINILLIVVIFKHISK